MGRSPCCDKMGLKKGTWTPEEDKKLLAYVNEHGHGSWRALPAKAGLQRCGKSCRLRWANYLRPDIKRGKFSSQEEQTIIQLHALLGNRWSAIATHLPKRTDNEIKNYWNTHLKKRLTKMGIDPVTHKPRITTLGSDQTQDIANLCHMTQWESARLEAEARLVRESRLVSNTYHQIHHSSSQHPLVPPLQWPQPLCLDVLKAWQGMWCNGALESPTSTLTMSENVLPPVIGSIDSQSWSTTDESMFMSENNCPSDWKAFESSSDINKIIKEETWNLVEVNDMNSVDNSLMEAFTNVLVDDIGDENCGGDFEQNKSCWSSILCDSVNLHH